MTPLNTQRFLILTIGLILCTLGCGPEGGNILQVIDLLSETIQLSPATEKDNIVQPDDILSETGQPSPAAIEASFEQNLLPILRARCAFAGCHVAGGPEGLDFSTYESFIRGGDDVFTPGNARSSDIVEEIVSGRMPPGGPRLPDDQIQLFIDWINQQEPTSFNWGDDDDDDDDDDDR